MKLDDLFEEESLEDTIPTVVTQKEEAPQIEAYLSQDGFIEVPIHRGFTEIEKVYQDITPLGGIICGGYVRYLASPRLDPCKAGDLDIYCPTQEIFDAVKSKFEEHLQVRVETEVALTYNRSSDGYYFPAPAIQLIKPIREGKIVANGDMEEILANFDFTVIRCGIKTPTTALVDADFIHDETKLILRLKNIHCPISSTLRCMKYAKKGYWMPPMHVLKLFFDWDNRDDDYKIKLAKFLRSANQGKGLSQEDINELEAMMRID
jgi:hypothetical protein